MIPSPSSRNPLLTVNTRAFSSLIHDDGGDGGDEIEGIAQTPLFPKTAIEWLDLFLQLAYAVLLLALYYSGGCPAIPQSSTCVIGNSVCVIATGLLRFVFGIEQGVKRSPLVAGAISLSALGTFGFFILGLVIVPVNVGYFSDPSPDTCERAPMVALMIPLALPALLCFCCLSSTCCALTLMCCGIVGVAGGSAASFGAADSDTARYTAMDGDDTEVATEEGEHLT